MADLTLRELGDAIEAAAPIYGADAARVVVERIAEWLVEMKLPVPIDDPRCSPVCHRHERTLLVHELRRLAKEQTP